MTQTLTERIPGYVAGTWTIDTLHSEVGFSVRHMMVSKVRGKFTKFAGEIVTAENLTDSSVTAEIDLASIETGSEQRDNHLRSSDFFLVEEHPHFAPEHLTGRIDGWTFRCLRFILAPSSGGSFGIARQAISRPVQETGQRRFLS